MTIKEKLEFVDSLSACLNRVCYLKILAGENNLPEEAEHLDELKNTLKKQIDVLLENLYKEWVKSAGKLMKKASERNRDLNKSIRKIEKTIQVSENIVKATACLDDLVKTAAGMMK